MISVEQEVDGRWIAEESKVPGAMVYGLTAEEALSSLEKLLREVTK